MSRTTTRGVTISIRPEFVPERSDQSGSVYFFAYHVRIQNRGDEPVQLLARHWIITDGSGKTDEVQGTGVVGEQPRLRPGEQFEYTSACPLSTAVGTMHGRFRMTTDGGEEFDANVAPFTLAVPGVMH